MPGSEDPPQDHAKFNARKRRNATVAEVDERTEIEKALERAEAEFAAAREKLTAFELLKRRERDVDGTFGRET